MKKVRRDLYYGVRLQSGFKDVPKKLSEVLSEKWGMYVSQAKAMELMIFFYAMSNGHEDWVEDVDLSDLVPLSNLDMAFMDNFKDGDSNLELKFTNKSQLKLNKPVPKSKPKPSKLVKESKDLVEIFIKKFYINGHDYILLDVSHKKGKFERLKKICIDNFGVASDQAVMRRLETAKLEGYLVFGADMYMLNSRNPFVKQCAQEAQNLKRQEFLARSG